jgi:hypothetical protein
VTSAGNALSDPVEIYTVNAFSGGSAAFDSETSKDVKGPTDVVIAINTKPHQVAIRTGADSHLRDTSAATQAFKNAFGTGNYTGATVAALQSLASTVNQAEPHSGNVPGPQASHYHSRSSGHIGLLGILCPVIIIGLIVAAVVAAFRRRGRGGGGGFGGGGFGGGAPGGYGQGGYGGGPGGYGPGYNQGGGISPGMAGGLGAAGGGLLGYELGKMEGRDEERDRGGYDQGGYQGGYDQGGGGDYFGGGGSDASFGDDSGGGGGFDGGGGGFDGGGGGGDSSF